MSEKEKKISKTKPGYDQGWRRGKSKGRHQALTEVHKIAEEQGWDTSVLPKIPTLRTNSPEQIAKRRQKLEDQLAKLKEMEAQLEEKSADTESADEVDEADEVEGDEEGDDEDYDGEEYDDEDSE